MSKKKEEIKLTPLESGLLQAMQAIDTQIARRMERSPADRQEHGVQKWEPVQLKVEEVTALALQYIGDEKVQLDSLLVMSQALSKALYLLAEELGPEGLGELRSRYCREAFESIERDTSLGAASLGSQVVVN